MAVRKTNRKKRPGQGAGKKTGSSRPVPLAAMFWLVFFLIVAGLFWINRAAIQKNYSQLISRLPGREEAPETSSPGNVPPPPPPVNIPAPAVPLPEAPQKPATESQNSRETPPSRPAAEQPEPVKNVPPAQPAGPVSPPASPPPETPQKPAPVEPLRDRNLYFTQVDKEGLILRSKTSRKIPPSDSPLLDSLSTLLQGPTTEEQRRGMVSLIPSGTRILSATVRGNTAYINFSEDFQYNTYGVEGYAAQLKQIVWTATEFPNVENVQILIEGRRVDYLGEGIWIGSPLNRDEL